MPRCAPVIRHPGEYRDMILRYNIMIIATITDAGYGYRNKTRYPANYRENNIDINIVLCKEKGS